MELLVGIGTSTIAAGFNESSGYAQFGVLPCRASPFVLPNRELSPERIVIGDPP